jgi:8-oxo-dGTP pyrophosphatase MutT (NUDIX family)
MLQLTRDPPDYAAHRRYAGVILLLPDRRVVLQRRDNHSPIVNPGLVSLFGGTVEAGESFGEAAIRELVEELEICAGKSPRVVGIR